MLPIPTGEPLLSYSHMPLLSEDLIPWCNVASRAAERMCRRPTRNLTFSWEVEFSNYNLLCDIKSSHLFINWS